jgi:hypothetical protein
VAAVAAAWIIRFSRSGSETSASWPRTASAAASCACQLVEPRVEPLQDGQQQPSASLGANESGIMGLERHLHHQIMTITIDLPPATEALLRAQAEAMGKNISALVVEAVEARLALT